MREIIKHFDRVISLGYNCFVRKFIDGYVSQETNFFDWIGSSMWSINELIQNDFKDISNPNDYTNLQITYTGNVRHIYTHKKYYLRFLHDFDLADINNLYRYPPNSRIFKIIWRNFINTKFSVFKDKYLRRAKRFQQLLNTKQKVLFIRSEENLHDRIIHQAYEKQFLVPELENVINFSKLIKQNYPNLDHLIIFISPKHENNYDPDNKIIILKDTIGINDLNRHVDLFNNLFEANHDFIMSAIEKNSILTPCQNI